MWQAHIPEDIHAELLNWAKWCWSGPWPHPLPAAECGSLEAGYRAPPEWDNLDERRTPMSKPNESRARAVQAAWEHLPMDERAVLTEEYPAALVPRRVVQGHEGAARRLGMTPASYEHLLGQAVRKIEKEIGDAIRA